MKKDNEILVLKEEIRKTKDFPSDFVPTIEALNTRIRILKQRIKIKSKEVI